MPAAGHRPAAGGWASPTRRPPAHPHGNLLPRASARPAALRRLPWDAGRAGRPWGAAFRGRASPGSGRVGFAHPPPRRAPPRQPAPPRQRSPGGPTAVAWERREDEAALRGGRRRSGAGAFGPGPRTCPLPGKARQRAGGLRPPAAAPPGAGIFTNGKKGSAKARPHDLWGRAHETLAGRYAATAPRLGQSRCPRPTGSGGLNRPAAGYEPRATAPAVARRSPCAQHRRGRSTGG